MNTVGSTYPHPIRRPMFVEISIHLGVVAANMLRIPTVASRKSFWKGSLRTL
jgi:hypothetical protein